MNVDLSHALQSCIDTLDELLRMTDQDRDRLSRCLSGDLLDEYLDGMDNAEDHLRELREQIRALQIEAQFMQ